MSEALESKIIEFGGEIRKSTIIVGVHPADKIITDDKQTNYNYENLIWAADLKTLYKITDTIRLSDEVRIKFEDVRKKLVSNRGGESVFSLFLEVDEPLDSFGKIATGHFFYTPSRQGLGDTHRQELSELIADFENRTREQLLDWLDRFISLNTFEISIPGLKDKELAPVGKTGMIISLLTDYNLFKKVEEVGWLEEFIKEMESRVIKIISDSVYPMLKGKIINHFSFSPLNYHKRIGSSEGAIVGWEFQKEMPVINKIQIADRSVLTPLPSVYQAGQWVYSPAGVPMSILTGRIAAKKI